VALSRDHKPSVTSEAERIIRCGGRIQSFRDGNGTYIGPLRVWLPDQDIPGLAMSRSIGDAVAARVGVVWEPGYLIYFPSTLLKTNSMIIIASFRVL
jgi:hypothetical protein